MDIKNKEEKNGHQKDGHKKNGRFFFNGMEQLSLEEIKEISDAGEIKFLIPIFAKMTILM